MLKILVALMGIIYEILTLVTHFTTSCYSSLDQINYNYKVAFFIVIIDS